MIKNKKLSDDFWLYEFLKSQTAERFPAIKAEQYSPPASVQDNLQYLVDATLQPIRYRIDFPMTVSSGYRCRALNTKVRGSRTSQHVFGEAADTEISDAFLREIKCFRIQNEINDRVHEIVGRWLRKSNNANFYLFAYLVVNLQRLDIDQVIHEYGVDGSPAWVHISSSRHQNKREILKIYHDKTGRRIVESADVRTALSWGVYDE